MRLLRSAHAALAVLVTLVLRSTPSLLADCATTGSNAAGCSLLHQFWALPTEPLQAA
jgi:hypothetical protein